MSEETSAKHPAEPIEEGAKAESAPERPTEEVAAKADAAEPAPAEEAAAEPAEPKADAESEALPADARPCTETEPTSAESAAAEPAQGTLEPNAPVVPEPPKRPRKKLGKPVIAAVAVVAAAVIIGGGFFAWNSSLDGALGAQAEADLAESGMVEAEVIPSQWGDQSGFVPETVKADSVERNGGTGTVVAEATANNGVYRATFSYEIPYAQQDGQWVAEGIEPLSRDYSPMNKIPDEALASHVGLILAEIDRQNANLKLDYPRTLADFFSGAAVTVMENAMIGLEDDVALELTATHDGAAYDGHVEALLVWDEALPDGPDWQFYTGSASADTYGAVGSVPHEGLYTHSSSADLEEAANMEVGWDEFWVWCPTEMVFLPDARYAAFGFQNIPHNTVDLDCIMTLNGTGEVLYESPRLWPNSSIDSIKLNRALEPGEYAATVVFKAYDRSTGALVGDSTQDDLKITVK